MSAALRTQSLRLRVAPAAVRAASLRPRAYATIPDPSQPTDKPSPNDVPKPSGGGGNGTLILLGGLAAVAGGYYYLNQGQEVDLHEQRKASEERVKARAAELRDAGKATAHDAMREGEAKYDETKAAAKDKLSQARASATQTYNDARSAAVREYDSAKAAVSDTAHKVERKYEEATSKTKAETQGWNQWFWSWFGYGKQKAEDAKREGAQKLADGAAKVEKEANKRS